MYLLFTTVVLIVHMHASAQTKTDPVTAVILHLDSGFWNAYNRCDTSAFKNYLQEDVEFYHDKGGITTGAAALIESLEKICATIQIII